MSRTRVERNISFDDEKKKYYVNLDFGRDARGRQIKKTRTFARLTDARRALRLHEVQRDFGALTQPNDTTVAQWLNYWMDAVVRPNRAATTVHGYSQMIVNHIIPQLGDIPLQSLSPQRIQQYYAYLCNDCGLSPNTARKHHDLLRNALRIAVMQDVLARNPTDRVEPPKFKRPEPHFYDVESLLRLLDAVKGTRLEPVVYLAGYLGLRREEMCGLRWKDVDFQGKTLCIHRARTMAGSQVIEKDTKNRSSTRLLHMPDEVVRVLRAERRQQRENRLFYGVEYHNTGYVLTWPNGEPYLPNYLTEVFSKFIRKNRLPKLTLHGLRHTFATLANHSGATIYNISKSLGHSTVATTSMIYTHLIDTTHEQTIEAVAQSLRKGNRERKREKAE